MEGPDAYAPQDAGEKNGEEIVRDQRGQDQPADEGKAQQANSRRQQRQGDPPMQNAERAYPNRDPAKKKTGEF